MIVRPGAANAAAAIDRRTDDHQARAPLQPGLKAALAVAAFTVAGVAGVLLMAGLAWTQALGGAMAVAAFFWLQYRLIKRVAAGLSPQDARSHEQKGRP